MAVFIALIGFLAFVSGYVVSLEERFQRDGQFRPFSVVANLKTSQKARKVLTWLGMLIWVLAAVVYVFGPEQELSTRDTVQLSCVPVIVFLFMLMGRAREWEFNKHGASANTWDFVDAVERSEWLSIALKAAVDAAKIFAVLLGLYVLKKLVGRG